VKFFLESALIDEISLALDMWDIDGLTLNLRHVQIAGKSFLTAINEINELFKGTKKTVSIQTNPHNKDDYHAIVVEAEKLAAISENFVIMMPCTEAGFKACNLLSDQGMRCNMTLCFSVVQALQAMRMDAFYVSPAIGWKEDNSEAIGHFIKDIVTIRDRYEFETEVLVSDVRNGLQIVEAAVTGADIVTARFAVYEESLKHPFTDVGLSRLQDYWDTIPYEG